MKRFLFAIATMAMAAFLMVTGGVDNVARGQSSLPEPTNVTAANGSNYGDVTVSWAPSLGAVYYRVGWMAAPDLTAINAQQPWPYDDYWLEAFHFVDIQNQGQTSFPLTRLTPGTQYAFLVASNDNRYGEPSWSEWSPWLELTPLPQPTQQQPGGASPTLTQPTNSGSIFSSSSLAYLAIDAGKNHTCGVTADNSVVCWGDNRQGQLDAPDGQFLSVSAGGAYSCGIDFDSELVCWGHSAIPVPPTGKYTQVSVGDNHACAVTALAANRKNRVNCWGLPNSDGRTTNADNDSSYFSVVAGPDYNCVRSSNYRAYTHCWGNSPGLGSAAAQEISAGGAHACGLYSTGQIRCFGNDVYGQESMIPSARDEGAVEDYYTYVSVNAGGNHTCGLRTTGNIRCWGSDLHGQATPPGANDELRVDDVGAGDFTAVSAGDSHTCGLRQGGAVVCWGQNTYGQASPR